MSSSMSIAVRATIKDIGPARLARAAGFPLSTVFRWMQEDRIPGRGAAHDMRLQKFTEVVNAIRQDQSVDGSLKKRRARAA